jgi:hypothetical protein
MTVKIDQIPIGLRLVSGNRLEAAKGYGPKLYRFTIHGGSAVGQSGSSGGRIAETFRGRLPSCNRSLGSTSKDFCSCIKS